MGFFGKIGIDWHLILAQIVNFAILLWFLRRFLYKPLLKGMENSDLEEAERQMEIVRQGQEELKKERNRMLNELKRKDSELVAVAEKVAEDIKRTARQKADDQKEKILSQAESLVRLQKDAAVRSREAELKKRLAEDLATVWRKRLGEEEAGRALQSVYLQETLAALRQLKAADVGTASAEFVLESSSPADKPAADELRRTLETRLKREKIILKTKRNKDLIAGYRLVLGGLEINNNLLSDIRHALGQE